MHLGYIVYALSISISAKSNLAVCRYQLNSCMVRINCSMDETHLRFQWWVLRFRSPSNKFNNHNLGEKSIRSFIGTYCLFTVVCSLSWYIKHVACYGTLAPCYQVCVRSVCSLFLHCKFVLLPYLFAACSLPRYIKHVTCVANTAFLRYLGLLQYLCRQLVWVV